MSQVLYVLASATRRAGPLSRQITHATRVAHVIDGAVRQFCMHKRDTIQELNSMLAEFNLQRSSVKINRNTTLWSHNSVWNKKYMDLHPGYTLQTTVGCLRTLHLPEGVPFQGSHQGSNTPNGQGTATPPTSQPTQ